MNSTYKLLFLAFFISAIIAGCKDPTGGDDPAPELPRISVGSVTLFEGDAMTTFKFNITLNTTSTESISVDYATEDLTAGAGMDYEAQSGTVTFAAGEQQMFVDIVLITDSIQEADEEFKVVLTNPVNATIQTDQGIGTIRNDDTYVFIPEDGYITPISYVGYTTAWSDEFDGSSLNTDDWSYEMGNNGWGNNELQYYTDRTQNSRLENGKLVIEAKEESFDGAPYTSARLITRGKQSFTWGRVDIRAIVPEGQGIWPALWMLGENFSSVGWPHCGEIDIMEVVGHEPNKAHGTAHWGPQGQSWSYYSGESYTLSGGAKYSDEYNVFSIIWEPNEITWLINDIPYHTLTPSDVNGNYPFNQEFFFIFNIAVGGNWPGNPDGTTVFPQKMIVDYIRVFQED